MKNGKMCPNGKMPPRRYEGDGKCETGKMPCGFTPVFKHGDTKGTSGAGKKVY